MIEKEVIETEVLIKEDDDEHKLQIVKEKGEDVVEFLLDGKVIFSGDWSNNFDKLFRKAQEKWPCCTE